MDIIAEIGTSHGGSLEKAFRMIDASKDAGATTVKFQWVYADEILHPATGMVELPGGLTPLYDVFKNLETDAAFYKSCLEYAHEKGIRFACSPFGLRSLEELAAINPDAIKIASPEVNHTPLLKACSKYFGKIPIILSSGVSRLGDIEKAISTITGGRKCAHEDDLTLLHCITSYPAPEHEYNVRCVETLAGIFGLPTGISDHSLDPVLVPVLTAACGGTTIEKHITLSKKTSGLDDPVALETEQFALMVHSVRQTEAILKKYGKSEVYRQLEHEYEREKIKAILGNGVKKLAPSEEANYGRTNRSIHFMHDMKKGDVIKTEDIAVLRTEKILEPGISPDFLEEVTGCVLAHDVASGKGLKIEDITIRA